MKMITDLRDRLASFNDDLGSGRMIQDIILEHEADIVAMNADEQLYEQGENALGVSIMSYRPYADSTIRRKRAKGQPYNRVTLRDEGDFERSFFLKVSLFDFQIAASDFKTEYLTRRYGDEILGLSDENVGVLRREYLYPGIMDRMKQRVYGRR